MVWFGAPCFSGFVWLATSNASLTNFCVFVAHSHKWNTLARSCSKKEVGFRYRIFSVCASDLKANAGSTEKIVARFAGLQTVKFWY